MSTNDVATNTLVVLFAIAVMIALAPLASIWGLNTLFNLAIPYTFWTWLAVLALGGAVKYKS